ncbi:hypothetical protein PJ267_12890 [Arthrobacter sp. OVS8]|nr:hypothetical protein PJ267_12890 [Arthrobacter sp. OVS8]
MDLAGLAARGPRRWSLTCAAAQGGGRRARGGGRALELHAADVDQAAVQCAARNLVPLGGEIHVGDLYTALPERLRGRVSVLAVNAPYVPSAEIGTMPREARLHEPRVSSTAVQTGFTSSGGWPPGRRNGWLPAATC